MRYDRPNPWEKENYRLVYEYKDLVKDVLDEVVGPDKKKEKP